MTMTFRARHNLACVVSTYSEQLRTTAAVEEYLLLRYGTRRHWRISVTNLEYMGPQAPTQLNTRFPRGPGEEIELACDQSPMRILKSNGQVEAALTDLPERP